ncbi:hypothetical protein B0H10DRAFT_1948170 [Mycena sp. CBHHK59/15]|nr:hypothetical protein B0H10DRAFT_1948170 [Mycena sp. CBHHK59/15]
MLRSTRLDKMIRYMTLAVSTAAGIADSAQVPFLGSSATLCQSILESVQKQTVKSNKDECIQMVENIHETLCLIIDLYTTSQTNGVLPPALLYDIGKFAETLQKVYTFIRGQQGMRKIKKIFKYSDNASQLEMCKTELQSVLERFKVRLMLGCPWTLQQLKCRKMLSNNMKNSWL